MCVLCACGCTHVYGCELTMGLYMRMCVYVYVHIGIVTYLRGNH